MKETLKYRLLDNGIDSIKHGIEHFLQGKENIINYKYAILHIFHGAELILKERLYRMNPILIYSNIDREIKEDHHTIGFDKLVVRLKNTGIELDERAYRVIQRMQSIRNQIEHKEVAMEINEVKLIIGGSIEFIIKFMRKELKKELKETIEADKYKILMNIIDFYDEKVKIAESEIDQYMERIPPKERTAIDVVFCPECNQKTIIIEEGHKEVTCRLCDESFQVHYCNSCGIPILLQFKAQPPLFCDICREHLFGIKK